MLVSTIISATDLLLSSRERHQFICGHRTSGSSPSGPPKPSHYCLAAIRAFHGAAARCLLQDHDPLSNHKSDLGVRLNSEPVPDIDGDRNLAFASNAHVASIGITRHGNTLSATLSVSKASRLNVQVCSTAAVTGPMNAESGNRKSDHAPAGNRPRRTSTAKSVLLMTHSSKLDWLET